MFNSTDGHSRESGNPSGFLVWMPACAGMTVCVFLLIMLCPPLAAQAMPNDAVKLLDRLDTAAAKLDKASAALYEAFDNVIVKERVLTHISPEEE